MKKNVRILFLFLFVFLFLSVTKIFTDYFPPFGPDMFTIKGSGLPGIITYSDGSKSKKYSVEKTITDPYTVRRLYHAMLALPPYPSTPVIGSCTLSYRMDYSFSFYKNNKLFKQGTMMIYPCGGGRSVSFKDSYKREFYTDNNKFLLFLEKSLGLTPSELFGHI